MQTSAKCNRGRTWSRWLRFRIACTSAIRLKGPRPIFPSFSAGQRGPDDLTVAVVLWDLALPYQKQHRYERTAPQYAAAGASVSNLRNHSSHRKSPIRVTSVDPSSIKRDLTASAQVLRALEEGFETGAYAAPPVARVLPLEQAREGYQLVADGTPGRIVLKP